MVEYILIIVFCVLLYVLTKNIGKTFPLFELTAVLYILQYGIAALLEYKYGESGSMAITKEEYLPFALFSCLAFIFGMFMFRPKLNLKHINIDPGLASKLGRIFVAIGLGGSVALFILPYSFKAVVTFFVILKLPGVYSLIFSNKKIDKIIILIIFLETSISAILNAMLIDFIVFSVFLTMFISLRYTISSKVKIAVTVFGLLFLTIYQGIKEDYRRVIWENEVSFEEKVGLLSELITIESIIEAFDTDIVNNESVIQTIHRLNQGWQTSMAMYQVPAVVPFEEGKALTEDIVSSLFPRIIYPDKRVVNDYQRFNHYTGYTLNSDTSMSIGVIGDIYINFGFYRSIIFLFFLGMVFSRLSLWFYKRFIIDNPINLIWLPFLFSYLIRPGNEFYMVLNHLIKALIIFFLIRKVIYPYLMKDIK